MTIENTVIVWVTKYALSQGITVHKAEVYPRSTTRMIRTLDTGVFYHGEGVEWHLTQESALRRAEAMRVKKVTSLRKQLKAMESLNLCAPHAHHAKEAA